MLFAVQLHFKNMTCISDSGFFYSLNIFNSNFVFLKLKKVLVSTRFLICIQIRAGCCSSLRCPQRTLSHVHSMTCVHFTCEESQGTLSSQEVGTQGWLSPGDTVLTRGWLLHPGSRWEESRAWNLSCRIGSEIGTLRMGQALQPPTGK